MGTMYPVKVRSFSGIGKNLRRCFLGGKAVGPRFKIHVIEKKLGDHGSSKRHFTRYDLSLSLNPCLCEIDIHHSRYCLNCKKNTRNLLRTADGSEIPN